MGNKTKNLLKMYNFFSLKPCCLINKFLKPLTENPSKEIASQRCIFCCCCPILFLQELHIKTEHSFSVLRVLYFTNIKLVIPKYEQIYQETRLVLEDIK